MKQGFEIFSTVTCPHCGHVEKFKMPLYAKRRYQECSKCHRLMTISQEECCVYCVHGDMPCPHSQQAEQPPPP